MNRAISWLLLEKILRVVSGVLVSTAVARYLGPASYGSLALALGVVGVASAAAAMGADHINLAQLSRQPGPEVLASALLARLLWAVACAAMLVGVAWLWWPEQLALFLVLTGLVLATAPLVFVHQMYADNQFRRASLFGMAAVLAAAAARLAGVEWQLDLAWFAACAVLESALLVLAAAVWARHQGAWQPLSVSGSEMRRYGRMCLPTLAGAVLVALYFRIELLVVDALLGAAAVGTWSAAMMFILPWNMASASVLPVVNRRLGTLGGDGLATRQLMVRLARAMLLLAVGCAVVNMMVVQLAVPLLLGPKYAESARIATICSIALVPLFLGAVQDVWLAQRGRNGVVLRKVVVGIPLSMALLGFGASQAGLTGAAIGMVVSYFATAIALNMVLDRDFFDIQCAAMGLGRG